MSKLKQGFFESSKKLFIVLFSFMLLGLVLVPSASAEPTVTLKLQVEEPTGSGIWRDAGVTRKTGETARYRLFYSISDTEGSTFENAVVRIAFPGGYNVLTGVSDFVLPSTVQNVGGSANSSGNKPFNISINFKNPTQAGVTGSVEFNLNSRAPSGPDGLLMTPTITMTGTTVKPNGTKEPLVVDTVTGPSWTVQAAASWSVTKTLVTNVPIYVPDEDAYQVEYEIIGTRTPWTSTVGSWGETSLAMVDQLPNIAGLTPEVIFAKRTNDGTSGVYNPTNKTITWALGVWGVGSTSQTTFRIRVKYPKNQVDALGGPAVLSLTNKARVEAVFIGDIPFTSTDATVTHKVSPSPAPIKGIFTAYKSASVWEILGNGLEYNDFSYNYYVGFNNSSANVNYRAKQIEVIDEGLTFTKTDNTIYAPDSTEIKFTSISVSSSYKYSIGGSWQFYYRTGRTGPWIAVGATSATSIGLPTGTVAWRCVITDPDYAKISASSMFSVSTNISKRTASMPLLKQVNNKATVAITYPDSSTAVVEASKVIPIKNDRKIVTRWYGTTTPNYWISPMSGSSLAPGRQAQVRFDAYVDVTSSVATQGVNFFALLPPEVTYNSTSTKPAGYVDTIVTPNFNGTGQTLVKVRMGNTYPALANSNPMPGLLLDISPMAPLTTYQIPLYMTITPTQAKDASITHSAIGGTSFLHTDTYDFDEDGDKTEKIAGVIGTMTLGASNAANVAKLSKGPYDSDWKASGSKIEAGQQFQYRIFFRNDSSRKMKNLVLIDILPRPGDVDPLTNTPRNSKWQPILTGPIAAPSGGTVYYSTSATPNMGAIVNNGWSGSWSTSAPGDLSTVRAIKIDFGNKVFSPGEVSNTYVTMKVPTTLPANGSLTRNTVNFSVNELAIDGVNTSPLLPASSSAIEMTFRIPSSKIGDFVWADLNKNGLQDATESGINGLKVELYGANPISNIYTKVGEMTTANHPTTQKPGYYLFEGLREGKYYVQFPTGTDYVLTTKNVGANRNTDSDVNADGKTDIIDLTDDTNQLGIDAGYASVFPVSGTLYYDIDANGAYLSTVDRGIAGHTVSLKNNAGVVVQTATTDATGKYNFLVAGSGAYTIEVDATTLQSKGFKETEPTLDNVNPLTTRLIVLGAGVPAEQNFGFKSINTVKAKVIWDTNKNDSILDATDKPLEGVKVKIWDLTDNKYLNLVAVTDTQGEVTFTGVFLDRSYRLDIDMTDTKTKAVLKNLISNVNKFNNVDETPLDGQITTGVLNTTGLVAVFGYKSQDSEALSLSAYAHLDAFNLNLYDTSDLAKSGVAVTLIDKETNLQLESGITGTDGKYDFTMGLVAGRAYQVLGTTPSGLKVVYNYLDGLKSGTTIDTIEVASYVKPNTLVRFGYRSASTIIVTGKVLWDLNHNDSLADAGIDKELAGVAVKLMSGTTVLATKMTNATGEVSFRDNEGLVIGGDYKLVVDKTASGNILTGLVANINMKNTVNETPIDDEIILTNLQNNDRGIWGYKSKDSNPNPSNTAKLNVWGHLDIAPLNQYNAGDVLYSGLAVKVTDVATGFTLESGTTDGTGKKVFTYGLAEGRSYKVEATTPSGLKVVYNYLDASQITPEGTLIAVNNYQTSMSNVRYGYRSSAPLTLTGQVMWDTNGNDSVADTGVDQNLAGVTVKLMSGTTELASATTDATGKVTFTDLHGLVVGQAYKIVVDKAASGALMTGLIANINQKNSINETPIDDTITIASFANNDAALLGYKSQDAVVGNMPKLTAYTHVDVATLNAYDATDLIKAGVPVRLVDVATGFTLESGTTDATGKYSFTTGLAVGRTYQVVSTTPSGLTQTYAYLGTTLVAVNPTINVTTYTKPETIVRFGYKSSAPISVTGKVVWDVNHNDSLADSGVDQNLVGVTVKLMSGTTVLGTKVTDANGLVSFNETNGLVIGNNYKLVVDKVATGAVLTSLNANVNQKNGVAQAPIDDEILLDNLQNNDAGLFGYKSKDSDPNPANTAKLPAWAYLDVTPMNQYDTDDIARANVAVQLVDVATGLTLQTGTTNASGLFEFNQGLADGRAYRVESTTPTNLELAYSYLNAGLVAPANANVAVASYAKSGTLVRYGYRSSLPLTLTGKVVWDTNHNNSLADATDQVLAGVSVKLMHGTTLLATATTTSTGEVTFTNTHGLIAGETYKLVVDKGASGTILTGLNANINQLNGTTETPLDDEIIITNFANNTSALFGYKSQDSDPNPSNTAKLSAYTYIDIPVLNSYDPTDLKRAGVAVKVTDTATGLILETGTTDSNGKYTFTYGLANGRGYKVEATSPAGLNLVYSYLDSAVVSPVSSEITIASYSKPEMIVRYGYKSTLPVSITTQVVWDVNHNGSLTDSGTDQNLKNVSVKLMSGTVLVATKITGTDGKVTFTEADGLVNGENYKVVIDKTATGAVLAGLVANVNQMNGAAQAPVDDEITITGLANGDTLVFGYKSEDSDPNPANTAKLTGYAHIDLAVLNQYEATDLNRSGVALQLIDQTTGFTLQTGTTDSTGKFVFTYGLSTSRSYQVKATTPAGMKVVYNYQDTNLRSPAQDTITLATYAKPETLVRFGYRSSTPLALTGDVKWQTTTGVTENLANVKVKLMNGTTVLSEKTTDSAGHVSFNESEGLIIGDSYKLVVDKGQTPAIFTNLVAVGNTLDTINQSPIDDEIVITVLANNQNGTFVYGKDPVAPAAGLKAYSHLDINPVGTYSVADPAYPAIAVQLKDLGTGLVVDTGATNAQGEFIFTKGVVSGRSYEVTATTPSGLVLSYGYLDTAQVATATKITITNLTANQLVRYGYGSSTPVSLTGKVVWDANHNGSLADSGTDRDLAGVSVKLMSGTNLLATKTTIANGEVSFNETDGLVVGNDYKLVVDPAASGAILTGLEANVNQRTTVSQTPIDNEIILTNLQNNEQGLFGYKSENSDPNPANTAKLNAWGYLDAVPLDQHNAGDMAYAGLSVKITDVATGFVLQTGTTDSTGKFVFTNGLADGRSYTVEATTPAGLKVVYTYLDATQITPANAIVTVGTYASTEMNVRYGYRSATGLTLTGQVLWDTNGNGSVADTGVDQKLAGITVKLMSGTTELATATTDTNGAVSFTDLHGLVVGQPYKLVVDKTASGAVMTGLIANINQKNGTNETPIDDTIIITSFANNDAVLLGYKSQDAVVGNMPKLTVYTHVDVATLNAYDPTDLIKAGVAVRLVDGATGFTLENGTTDATGKYSFTTGLAEGRTYQVVSTTPSDLTQTYAYLGTTLVTVNPTINVTTYTKPETIVRFGYRSTNGINITGKVVWDVNHNDNLADSGVDQNLAGVTVKLMSGTTLLGAQVTDASGLVTFTQNHGLVVGNDYKLVVDKTTTGAVLTGLNANINQKNGVTQTPVDDEIVLANLQNNDASLFGYKSKDSDPNPTNTAKLPAWTYLDIAPMDQYNVGDVAKASIAVQLVDVATGLTIQTGTTNGSGLFEFNQGLADGRAYRVESTTPAGLKLVYSYLNAGLVSPANVNVAIPNYAKTSTLVRYGYRSSGAVVLTGKVVWDTNHNDSITDSTDQTLAGVSVKLMHGANLMATGTTNATGEVTFTDAQGLVAGEAYKLVVDKTASGAILSGLNANVNLLNNTSQTPIDDEIIIAALVNNDSAVFGYKSQDSDPNPTNTAKLSAYTYIDIPVLNSYDLTDLKRAGVAVQLKDSSTGLVLENGTTDSNGKYTFTYGLANGRAYKVEATSSAGLNLVYSYLDSAVVSPASSEITIASYSKPEMIVRYGYKSTLPVSITTQVVWDVNHNGSLTDSGTDQNLKNVSVKLMSGAVLVATKTTGTDGKVTFTEADGLVNGENYKVVIDKTATGAALAGLVANVNQMNGVAQAPVDDEITITGLADGDALVFGYKSEDSDPNPANTAKLTGYTHIDLAVLNQYEATDLNRSGVALQLIDQTTGFTLQTGTTDSTGKFVFTYGLSTSRSYQVKATTPAGMQVVYNYQDTNLCSPAQDTITLATYAKPETLVRFGYRSSTPLVLTGDVKWQTTTGVTENLANVKVKLMNGTTVLSEKTTDSAGHVSFNESEGLIIGDSYKLVVDKGQTPAIFTNLVAVGNTLDTISQSPIDDEIIITVLANNQNGTFVYGKDPVAPAAGLKAYSHLDINPVGTYSAADPAYPAIAVQLKDVGTGVVVDTGATNAQGEFIFTKGVVSGRSYEVTATTPSGLVLSYGYLDAAQVATTTNITVTNLTANQLVRYGYGSSTPVSLTGKVVWDVNHNGSLADSGTDRDLAGVSVKLMSGTNLLATKTTIANGEVSFNETDGLVVGNDYKLVVDPAASGAILNGLEANVNQRTTVSQTPIDNEIILTNLQNNEQGLFGYKSENSDPNPANTAKLNAWGYLDAVPLDQHNAGDMAYAGLSVKITDVATGFVLQTGTTDSTGKFVFTNGLADGRSYTVEATTPAGLKVVYNYLDAVQITPANAIVTVGTYASTEMNVRYGYRSATTLTLTGQVLWDTNDNGSVADTGVDQKLTGVTVKLMSGTTELATATTDTNGAVSFTDLHGLVVGQPYKLVVDKTASGAVMTGLIANINQKNGTNETPIDDTIIITSFANNDAVLLGYKSQDAVTGNMPKLTAYTHVDVATLNAYDPTDLIKAGVALRLVDVATGFTLESGTTDAAGKYSFTTGLAEGRTYQVVSTTPSDLTQTYAYLGTTLVTVNPTINVTTYTKPETIVRFGYRSTNGINITGKVVWDVNHNDSLTDSGVDKDLAGVTVKLMSGTTLLGTQVTDASGLVTFTQNHGLVVGNDYKLVVDKTTTGAVLTGLNANINQKNGVTQTPVDDEIVLANLQNNDAGLFGYKSQDSDPNPTNTAKLPAWAYLDIAPLNQYGTGDILRANVAVQLVDVATGLTLQTGVTSSAGVFEFTQGLANGRAYRVESTTPSGLELVYSYLNAGLVSPASSAVAITSYDKASTLVRYGYRSSVPVSLKGKVVWDMNHNDSITDSADQALAGVSVKLMHGTTLMATGTTDATGAVSFDQNDGIVIGETYKLVVDKTVSGAILTGLNANVNLINNTSQTPIDDEIVVANFATNDLAVFGYKSQDSDPNPTNTAKLTAYTYLDLPTFGSYDLTDLKRAGVTVKITDTATGLVLENGTTDSMGKYTFTNGLANGRAYRVEATSPNGLDLVYSYLNTTGVNPVSTQINIASYSKPEMIVRYGYKSTLPVSMTAQVVWDVNHNGSVTDSGVDKNLSGVSVKLLSGTVLITTKNTGTDGKVTFTEDDGLVNGEDYKILVDKTGSGAVLAGLAANVNQLNGAVQAPIDNEMTVTGLADGAALVFGYKSEDSDSNPANTAKLSAYAHIDLAVLSQYDPTDLNRSGVAVELVDQTTGFTLQTGTTDATGKFVFTYGLSTSRSYQVKATTPAGMQVVYNYQDTNLRSPAQDTITLVTYAKPETLVRFGYRSSTPLALTGDVKWQTAAGVTENLANVKVKLMNGTTVLSEKTTDSTGRVSFDDSEGLIIGDSYKLVVDKTQTPNLFIGLVASQNLLDSTSQSPINDEIIITVLANNQNGTFVYGKDPASSVASLKAYTHLDIAPIGAFSTLDQAYPTVSVQLKDVATGLIVETGITNTQGFFTFTQGVASGRAYEVEAITPTGLTLTYGYRDTSLVTLGQIIGVPTLTNNQLVRYGYRSNQPITLNVDAILDLNGNRFLVDSVDIGIANVTAMLNYNGVVIATKTTDSTGNIKFTEADGVIPGWDYVVTLDATSQGIAGMIGNVNFLNTTELAAANNIVITGIANGDTAKFGYQGNGGISGYVTREVQITGYRLTDDQPLTGLTVTLKNTAGLSWTTTTDNNGYYEFEHLPNSTYTIEITRTAPTDTMKFSYDPDDTFGTTPQSLDKATLGISRGTRANTGVHTDVNFGYILGGSIEAVVYKDATNEGAYNPNHPRYGGAKVFISSTPDMTGIFNSAVAGENGQVSFVNLDPAATYYLITQYGPTYAPLQDPLAQALYVTAGQAGATQLHNGVDPESDVVVLPVNLSAMTDGDAKITDAYFVYSVNNHPVTISKIAGKDQAMIGDMVPYTIKITNNESKDANNLTLNDLIPAGFKYVDNSGRYTDASGTITKVNPTGTRPIAFTGLNVPAGQTVYLRYILVVGSGVTPGDYVNKAHSLNAAGFQNSNTAQATVRVTADALFDDSLIFGKVFHDINRNGRQDKNELGISGVKLVTARGEIITTDEHGRYHLADVSGGRWERGTNFILKLDTRSLPQGLTTTTENPIVVRLSPGLPSRINFGVEVPPPVAARLAEQLALEKAEEVKHIEEKLLKEEKFVVESIHFAFDQDQIEPNFENTLDSLAEVLRLHPEWKIRIEGHTDSLGTEAYNKDLSQRRANAVKAYLLKTGVNSPQLVDAVGLGLSEPVADNSTPEGRYKNRRVEFKLEK